MLQKSAAEASTLELIRRLQNDEKLAGFYLAGGTALALFLGHRRSVDIDLFTLEDFDTRYLLEHLEHLYGFSMQYITQNTLKGTISGIFVVMIYFASLSLKRSSSTSIKKITSDFLGTSFQTN